MILVVSDKFKGTLSSEEAGNAIACGLFPLEEERACRIVVEAMADGGEGTAGALGGILVDGVPGLWRLPGGDMIVESAACIGHASANLMCSPLSRRSSRAFGDAVIRALRMSAPHGRVFAAIGGTSTADGGAGMLQAFGYTFYGRDGLIEEDITSEIMADRVVRIDVPAASVVEELRTRLYGLSDVRAALCDTGRLSALDFLEQKGLTDGDEKAVILRAFLRMREMLVPDGEESAFDGAGGGVGFALASVAGVSVVSGAEYVLARILSRRKHPRLLVTGEGSVDRQTAGGKVVETVNAAGRRDGIPVLTVGGRVCGHVQYQFVVAAGKGDVPVDAEEAARRVLEAVGAELPRIRSLMDTAKG